MATSNTKSGRHTKRTSGGKKQRHKQKLMEIEIQLRLCLQKVTIGRGNEQAYLKLNGCQRMERVFYIFLEITTPFL